MWSYGGRGTVVPVCVCVCVVHVQTHTQTQITVGVVLGVGVVPGTGATPPTGRGVVESGEVGGTVIVELEVVTGDSGAGVVGCAR